MTSWPQVTPSSALLQWVAPEGHTRLKAFNIHLKSNDSKVIPFYTLQPLLTATLISQSLQVKRDVAVKHLPSTSLPSFLLDQLPSATEFVITIRCVCVFDTLKTLSEVEQVVVRTVPEPPSGLVLEGRTTNSLTVRWDLPGVTQQTHR